MKILIVLMIILSLLYLIAYKKLNAFLSILSMSLLGGIVLGLPLPSVVDSVEQGIGSILGSLALILGLGAMIAKLMEDSGAAHCIATTIIQRVGGRHAQLAVVVAGILIGFALFFDAAFILFIPIVLSIAKQMKAPALWLGLPAASALLTIHTFFPPHPGMVEVIRVLKVDEIQLIGIGFPIALLSIFVSGILLPRLYFRNHYQVSTSQKFQIEEVPAVSFRSAAFFMILPIFLIALGSFATQVVTQKAIRNTLTLIGHPVVALLLTLLALIYFYGYRRGISTDMLMTSLTVSVQSIANVLLINGAGGGLKQIFMDVGITKEIAQFCEHWQLNPVFLAFLFAALMRVLLGSSTIAALTAASMVQGLLIDQSSYQIVLIALSVGAGSMFCSHINDPGFWLFKQYFDLDVKQTLSTWTMMTIIGGLTSLGILSLLSFLY